MQIVSFEEITPDPKKNNYYFKSARDLFEGYQAITSTELYEEQRLREQERQLYLILAEVCVECKSGHKSCSEKFRFFIVPKDKK